MFKTEILLPDTMNIVIGNLNNPTDSSLLKSYSIWNRLPGIIKLLKNADVVVFSEVYSKTVNTLKSILSSHGFICHINAYSVPGIKTSPFHIIGVRHHIKILHVQPIWFTSTPEHTQNGPDPLLENCGEQFSKSALSVVLEYRKFTLIVTGTHFSLPRYYSDDPYKYQRESASILISHISGLRVKFPNASLLLGSDFNTFSDTVTNMLENFGLMDITPLGDTFVSFPTDLGLPSMRNKTQSSICAEKFSRATSDMEIIHAAHDYFMNTSGDLLRARLDRIYWLSYGGPNVDVSMTDMSKITLSGILSGRPQSVSDHAIFNISIS